MDYSKYRGSHSAFVQLPALQVILFAKLRCLLLCCRSPSTETQINNPSENVHWLINDRECTRKKLSCVCHIVAFISGELEAPKGAALENG